jgi:2-haloacid dehalogenase
MMTNKIAAVVFDAYGTLFDVHSVTATCERLFPGKGTTMSQLWRSKQLEYTWLRALMGRYADFNCVTEDSLRYVCNALGLAYSRQALDELMLAYRRLQPFDDARETLAALQGKVQLAILSNGAPQMLNAVVAHNGLGQYFSAVLSVDPVRTFKPSPDVYRIAVDKLGVAREKIAFVSSNGWDAAGAKAFGLTVFWVNRAGAPLDELGVQPDAVLKSLAEIPALIV